MRIQARKLLQFSTDELWDMLDGPFTLIFDDGELLTDHKQTLFSSYAWDLIREYSALPFTSRYHFGAILEGGTMGGRTFSTQYSRIVWDIYRYYCAHPELLNGMSPVIFREVLSKKLYDVVAKTYNDLTYRLEEYVISISIEDFIEVVDYPELQEIHNQVNYTEAYVEHAYDVAKRVIIEEPEAAKKAGKPDEARAQHNILSRLARANLIDMNQLNQCVVMRGFMTDIGSHQFTIPITSNLVTGIRGLYESLIESRSASKSLAFQAKPLQDSEFFNRRSQMGAQVVTRLLYGDCGSTEYNYWAVRESDLPNIEGKYYYCDKEKRLLEVKRTDTHLVGTTIKMRSPMSCMAEDPNGVCETCFGALANAVYRDTNIGMQTTSYLNEIISQAVLGVKHLDGSSKIEPVTLDEHDRRYLSVTRTGDGYTLQNAWKGKPIKLVINPAEAPGFTDIREVSNVKDLSFTRTTMLDTIGLDIEQNGVFSRPSIQVGLIRRPASLTHEMLSYIREHGWELDSQGNYVVNLEHWDTDKVMMVVPRRNFNMSDHSKEIASMLESSKDDINSRNSDLTKSSFIMELFDLVNSHSGASTSMKLSVNLAVLEIIAYSVMVVNTDPQHIDYSLPKPWTRYGFGVYRMTITRRSLGTTMAYQEQRDVINDPVSFTYTNRIDTPMDVFLDPAAVLAQYHAQQS